MNIRVALFWDLQPLIMGQKLCLVIERPILNLGATLNESSGVKI